MWKEAVSMSQGTPKESKYTTLAKTTNVETNLKLSFTSFEYMIKY